MEETEVVNEAKVIAQKAMTKGTFSFTDMLQDRTYPVIETKLYLDEAKALRLVELAEEEKSLDDKVFRNADGASVDQVEAFDRIDAERAEIRKELDKKAYTITVRGFDPDDWETLMSKAEEEFPVEYEDGGTNPLTGKVNRTAKPSPARAKYFGALIWGKAITEVRRYDGAVLEDMSVEDWMAFTKSLPKVTRDHVDLTIQKVQVASDWYKGLTDEVF